MGAQRVLQAAVAVAFWVAAAPVVAAPPVEPRAAAPDRERIAVIDLGGAARARFTDVARQLQAAIIAAGFAPVIGDGVEDALAGRDTERDAAALAAAMAAAEHAFGALACQDAL